MFCYAALPLLRLLLFAPPLFLTSFIFFVGGKFKMTIIFLAAFKKMAGTSRLSCIVPAISGGFCPGGQSTTDL
jgi:hypothetical protein